MSQSWLFDTTVEGWVRDSGSSAVDWVNDGYPSPGCISKDNSDDFAPAVKVTAAIAVNISDPFSCRVRLTGTTDSTGSPNIDANMQVRGGLGSATVNKAFNVSSSFDTGWFLVSGTVSTGGTSSVIAVTTQLSSILTVTMYVDSVYVGVAAPSPTTGFELIQSAGGIPGAVKVTS